MMHSSNWHRIACFCVLWLVRENLAFPTPHSPRRRILNGRRVTHPLDSSSLLRANNNNNNYNNNNTDEPKVRPGSLRAATLEQGRVPYGEDSRKYRRTVFSHSDWLQHRSSERLLDNLKGIFFSGIVRQLQTEVGLVSFVALLVVLWNSLLVPSDLVSLSLPYLKLPSLPFTLSSPALGLLLVFRTNSSYQRWLEARITWGKVTSQSRNLVRMATTFCDMQDLQSHAALERLSRSSWLFCRTLMHSLSGPEDQPVYESQLRSTFVSTNNDDDDDELWVVERLLETPDGCSAALMEVSLALDDIPIDEKRRVEIDKSLVLLGDCIAACQRIYTSPVPLVYTRHTARFLTLWMLLVPLSLYDVFASLTSARSAVDNAAASVPWLELQELALVPAVAVIALFFFGIEELAVQLEEPFSILPMQKFCDDVLESSHTMMDWSQSRRSSSHTKDLNEE